MISISFTSPRKSLMHKGGFKIKKKHELTHHYHVVVILKTHCIGIKKSATLPNLVRNHIKFKKYMVSRFFYTTYLLIPFILIFDELNETKE